MYLNSAAVIRQDLNTFVEEAAQADQYYIGQKILPVLPSPVKSGIFPKISISPGELLRAESTKRGPTGTYNEVDRKITTDTFDCKDRGLEERIDDVFVRDMSRFFDVEVLTSKLITRMMMLDYEIRVAGKVFDESVFTTTNSSVEYTEGNLATIDIAADLMAAKERLTRKAALPNTMVLNDSMFNRIRRSGKLQTFLYGSIGAGTGYRLVNAQDLGAAFNIPNVYVAAATYDASKKGAASATLTQVWGSDYFWLGNVQGGDFSAMGAGRTMVWTADSPSLFQTETYRSEPRRGDMVRVRHHTDEKIVDATSAELVKINNQ
jgi:hypothetical protein